MIRLFALFFSMVFLFSCTGEKKRRRELTGNWKVLEKSTLEKNFLNYDVIDTLQTDSCLQVGTIPNLVEIEYRFMSKNKVLVIEKHASRIWDPQASISCSQIFKDTIFTNEYAGTWDIEGPDNLLVIYNDQVENIIIRDFSKTSMKWERDITVAGGIVSFAGVVSYSLERL